MNLENGNFATSSSSPLSRASLPHEDNSIYLQYDQFGGGNYQLGYAETFVSEGSNDSFNGFHLRQDPQNQTEAHSPGANPHLVERQQKRISGVLGTRSVEGAAFDQFKYKVEFWDSSVHRNSFAASANVLDIWTTKWQRDGYYYSVTWRSEWLNSPYVGEYHKGKFWAEMGRCFWTTLHDLVPPRGQFEWTEETNSVVVRNVDNGMTIASAPFAKLDTIYQWFSEVDAALSRSMLRPNNDLVVCKSQDEVDAEIACIAHVCKAEEFVQMFMLAMEKHAGNLRSANNNAALGILMKALQQTFTSR